MITLKLTDKKVIDELKIIKEDLGVAYINSDSITSMGRLCRSIARLETIINLSQED